MILPADILTFNPIYKSVLWGGHRIAALKGERHNELPIGESWEMSVIPGHESVVATGPLAGIPLPRLCQEYGALILGENVVRRFGLNFPLLIKFIDARDRLSLQVHPAGYDPDIHGDFVPDPTAHGKSELWYVMECQPDSIILAGLNGPLSPKDFARRITDGTIMDIIGRHPSAPGQFYYLPSGTIHAIGAGNLIAEVQESSDITYRIYDYDRRDKDGNLRDLHTDQARQAIDYRFPNTVTPTATIYDRSTKGVVDSPRFTTDYVVIDDDTTHEFKAHEGSFTILMFVAGTATITIPRQQPHTLSRCHTALIPACIPAYTLSGPARLLSIHL